MSALVLDVEVDGVVRRLAFERNGDIFVAQIDGRAVPVDVCEALPGVLSLLVQDGDVQRSYRCIRTAYADEETIALIGQQHRVTISDPRSLRGQRKRPAGNNGAVQIKSSMPGRVARVLVTEGETVDAHQGIVVIEAMKMQNELKSPRPARVAAVRVTPGDKVGAGQVLAVLE